MVYVVWCVCVCVGGCEAAKAKMVRRGIKEVVKAIRKGEKGFVFLLCVLCVCIVCVYCVCVLCVCVCIVCVYCVCVRVFCVLGLLGLLGLLL